MKNSGAYIFRPSTSDPEMEVIPYSFGAAKFINTSVGMEVHVGFGVPWLRQVTRVMNGQPFIEIEYSIGPVPIEDGRGKEIVSRLSTSIQSSGIFYTDSNGREFLERRRDYRPSWPLKVFEPVAGNVYPVNAAVYIEDQKQGTSLSVVVDRALGGASLTDGSLDLMVQRRIIADDDRGVSEPLNETVGGGITPCSPFGNAERYGEGVVVRGIHRVLVGTKNEDGSSNDNIKRGGAGLARTVMDQTLAAPLVFVASSTSNAPVSFRQPSFSGLQQQLPPSIMLITFKKLHNGGLVGEGGHSSSAASSGGGGDDYLVRLAHQYAKDEDQVLSEPVSIDLAKLLAGFKITSVVETTLTANQELNDWVKRRMDWTGSGPLPLSYVSASNTTITLQPMEIRTFVMKLELQQQRE
jgi:hypothetical protein